MASGGRQTCRGGRTRTIREAIAFDLGIPIEEIRPEARMLWDLEIDLFDLQELLEALEDEFDMELPDGGESIRTIADIERAVHGARRHEHPLAESRAK